MKRMTIIAMILSVLLTLNSCQIIRNPQETFPETETEETLKETENKESSNETEIVDPLEIYDWHWWDQRHKTIYADRDPYIDQVDEFKAFCQYPPFQEIFPSGFLGYDELSPLGSFYSMGILGDNGYGCYFHYYDEGDQYSEGRFTFSIKIVYLSDDDSHDVRDKLSQADQSKVFEATDRINDMTTNNSGYRWIVYDNMIYEYTGENLDYIRLIIDNYEITVHQSRNYIEGTLTDCYFKDYAPAEPNFITLLLEGAEYEAVAESFRQMISTEAE